MPNGQSNISATQKQLFFYPFGNSMKLDGPAFQGLSIAHDGRIRVESTPGKGPVLTIKLPLAKTPNDAAPQPSRS